VGLVERRDPVSWLPKCKPRMITGTRRFQAGSLAENAEWMDRLVVITGFQNRKSLEICLDGWHNLAVPSQSERLAPCCLNPPSGRSTPPHLLPPVDLSRIAGCARSQAPSCCCILDVVGAPCCGGNQCQGGACHCRIRVTNRPWPFT
jgi:hypothetical protein